MTIKSVVLINPFTHAASGINEATVYPPIGLAYLASVLRNNNIKVKIIDANIMKLTNEKVMKMLISDKPDLVGLSLNIVSGVAGLELSKIINKRMKLKVCLGGPLVSTNTEKILNNSGADFAVVGEGENTLLKICKGKSLSEVKGVVWKSEDGRIVNNGVPDLIKDLDTLPVPAYDLLPPFMMYRSRARRLPVGYIITSRGCPFQCTFCSHNIFGKKFRGFSPEYVIREIEFLVSKFKIKQLDVLDDNFTLDIHRAEEILDMIIEKKFNILINFQTGLRVDRLNHPIIKKMKRAGIFKVGIGIESGSTQILKETQKSLELKKVPQVIEWFKNEGIVVIGFFIIGFPNDTKETINATINFAIKANPSIANFMLLVPFPGTKIYYDIKESNLLEEDVDLGISTGLYESKLYHRCPNLTKEEIYKFQRKAYKKFNFRVNKILETLSQIRSISELKWYFDATIPIIKNLFLK